MRGSVVWNKIVTVGTGGPRVGVADGMGDGVGMGVGEGPYVGMGVGRVGVGYAGADLLPVGGVAVAGGREV